MTRSDSDLEGRGRHHTGDPQAVIGPRSGLESPRYAGLGTFARLPLLEEVPRWDVALFGIPFDSGVTYRPGARFGPAGVRQASRLLRPYDPEQSMEPFAVQQVVDAGDCDCNPFNIEAAVSQIQSRAGQLLQAGSNIIAIGGDHTIALPMLRAVSSRFGPVAVVHFDAHLDTWDTYFGARYTHGTPFRRASEEGLIDLQRCMHVGVRGSIYSSTDLEDDSRLGFTIVRASDFERSSIDEVAVRVRRRVGDGPVYVSVDVDVLDPSHAPGTGTPEAGGLTSRELLGTLRGLSECHIVGADVVEFAPAYDVAEITGVAAAHVVYCLLGLLGQLRKGVA